MGLSDYLNSENQTQTALAAKLGVSQGLVSQWAAGQVRITAERAIEIEEATNGAVSKYDLRPDIFGPSPAKPKRAVA